MADLPPPPPPPPPAGPPPPPPPPPSPPPPPPPLLENGLAGPEVGGGVGATPTAMVEEEDRAKMWERPWSVSELKHACSKWTLASDAGMLLYLKEFSQRMISKTHEIEKQVDTLVHEAKGTDTRMNNVFNDFLMLANIQFVENRVWEEADEDGEKKEVGEEGKKDKDEDRSREEKQLEITGRIKTALDVGLKVLDDAFDALEYQHQEDSEDELEESYAESYSHEPILEPKDHYALRPLPWRIGTPAFENEDDVGLREYASDSDGEGKGGGGGLYDSESDTEEETDKEAGDEHRGDSDSLFAASTDESATEKEDEEEEDEEEDEESGSYEEGSTESSEEEEEGAGRPTDLQAELAAKFKAKRPALEHSLEVGQDGWDSDEANGEVDTAAAAVTKPKKKKRLKKKGQKKGRKRNASKASQNSKDEGDLFASQGDGDLFEEDGTPFGKKNGMFSGGGALFDEEEDQEEAGEEGAKSSSTSDLEASTKGSRPGSGKSRSGSVRSHKKLPGAVPMFGGVGASLFGAEEEEEEEEGEEEEGKPEARKIPKLSSGGLFDEEEEDWMTGSVASATKPAKKAADSPPPVAKKRSSAGGLFDLDGEDELFGDSAAATVSSPTQSKKKKPVGGVSVFGDAPSFLPGSPPSVSDQGAVTSPKTKKKAAASAAPVSTPFGGGLFDDEADGGGGGEGGDGGLLFGGAVKTVPSQSSSGTPTQPTPPSARKTSGGIFDDDDALFGAEPPAPLPTASRPPTASKPPTAEEPKKKKPAGAVSIFGGADLFGDLNQSSLEDTPSPLGASLKSTDAPVPQPKPKKVGGGGAAFGSSLFDEAGEEEDDIFSFSGSAIKKAKSPPLKKEKDTAAAKPEEKKKAKPVSTLSHSLFGDGPSGLEDSDDLFSPKETTARKQLGKPASTTVDPLFGGLDREEEEGGGGGGDLFSAPAKKSTARPAPSQHDSGKARTVEARSLSTSDPLSIGLPQPIEPVTVAKATTGTSSSDRDLFDSEPPRPPLVAEGANPLGSGGASVSAKSKATPKETARQASASDDIFGGVESGPLGGIGVGAEISAKPPVVKKERERDPLFSSPEPVEEAVPAPAKPSAKLPQPVKSKPHKSGGLFDDDGSEDDLFSISQQKSEPPAKKPPAGAVSLFGGVDPFAGKGGDGRPTGGLLGDDPFSSVPSATRKAAPEVSRKPQRSSTGSESAPSPTSPAPSKLKTQLHIDPKALLPGATPFANDAQEKAVSFDQPVQAKTLDSLTKSRPRGAVRRPPSRHRLQSGSQSDGGTEPLNTSGSVVSNTSDRLSRDLPPAKTRSTAREPSKSPRVTRKPAPATASKKSDSLFDDHLPETRAQPVAAAPQPAKVIVDELENEISRETGLFSSTKGTSKVAVSFGDDLFGGGKESVLAGDTNDLFGGDTAGTASPAVKPRPSVVPKPEASQGDRSVPAPALSAEDNLFSSPPVKTKPPVDIFEAPPDDIFASSQEPKQPTDDIFSADKGGPSGRGLDDLLTTDSSKTARRRENGPGVGGQEGADGGGPLKETGAAVTEAKPREEVKKKKGKATKKTAKKHKERTDEELFGNTDDIFGDLPAAAQAKSPKLKKKKKKAESAPTGATPPGIDGEGAGGGGGAEKRADICSSEEDGQGEEKDSQEAVRCRGSTPSGPLHV